jgi:hypothetical protein
MLLSLVTPFAKSVPSDKLRTARASAVVRATILGGSVEQNVLATMGTNETAASAGIAHGMPKEDAHSASRAVLIFDTAAVPSFGDDVPPPAHRAVNDEFAL